ncbi:hypothetical protein ERO13_A11G205300v2 [Gossypium hirsutum]|uniref:Uncharacterized protein n=3 Tax=Gossypium TaxID=3633 RepID=A0A5J5TTD6_GOSBA|nr:hypothetical protein ES319_A11G214800v1 [Gossypium barbadense]KAG4175745.1 hypothetical protein ERO13_A11G205300v2 [Gossypium hirsutum]TYG94992.1 hypothetical protein ES288_A11G232100v1 [Gossypium darwinii]TYI01867.1 hypothetical protein ES332_A11G230300v1 [Gossypium tomentosum]
MEIEGKIQGDECFLSSLLCHHCTREARISKENFPQFLGFFIYK